MYPFLEQLAELCRAQVTRNKWVFVPTHAIGRTLGERIALAGTSWLNLRPRATALLARQVLEGALDDLWRRRALGAELCSARAQLVCLPAYLHGAEALAKRASYAWARLSWAGHEHAYELPRTALELVAWIEVVEQLVAHVRVVTASANEPTAEPFSSTKRAARFNQPIWARRRR